MKRVCSSESCVTHDLVREHAVRSILVGEQEVRNAGDRRVEDHVRLGRMFGADPRYMRGPGLGFSSVLFRSHERVGEIHIVPTPPGLARRDRVISEMRSLFVHHVRDVAHAQRRVEHPYMRYLVGLLKPLMRTVDGAVTMDRINVAWDIFVHSLEEGDLVERISHQANRIQRADVSGSFLEKFDEMQQRLSMGGDSPELTELIKFGKILKTQEASMVEGLKRLTAVAAEAVSANKRRDGQVGGGDATPERHVERLNYIKSAVHELSAQVRRWYRGRLNIESWSRQLHLSAWMAQFERESIQPLIKRLHENTDGVNVEDFLPPFAAAKSYISWLVKDISLTFESLYGLVPNDILVLVSNSSHYVRNLLTLSEARLSAMGEAIEDIAKGESVSSRIAFIRKLLDGWTKSRERFFSKMNEKPALQEIERLFSALDFHGVSVEVKGKEYGADGINDGVLFMILYHLVDNALDFKQPDVPLHIMVEARRGEGVIDYAVSDNGLGMTPDRLAEIRRLKPGMRLASHHGSSGLGLSTVLEMLPMLVDGSAASARLYVQSVMEQGSTFILRVRA